MLQCLAGFFGHISFFGHIGGYVSLFSNFLRCCGSKKKAANQLSRRSRRYKKAGCYRGDHSKLSSLPEFGLSMLFSLLSIFITVIFLIRSSAVTFLFGALNRTWILQSKPNWNASLCKPVSLRINP